MVRGEWSARVLGPGGLLGPGGQRLKLERRAAALLAYLGVEGPSGRAFLSGLLWPDSPATTARGNLRQLLRRLRVQCAGEALVQDSAELLSLSPGLWLDVADVKTAASSHAHERVLAALPGEGGAPVLLAGLDVEAGDELSRWLTGARTAVDGWVRTAREARISHHLDLGHWESAQAELQAWLRQEPESEQAGRHLIRMHYLQGDRGAALAAFERLRAVLSRELGVSPMPETLLLVRRIEQGTLPSHPPPRAARPPLPLSVQRPPVLWGRAGEWRQLEEGWRAGQVLFIRGEPGVGKSRLAEEFAASKGRWVCIQGRFADPGIPFSSQARALRLHLNRRPGVVLPEWVRGELSRVLPELEPHQTAPPLDSAARELRFLEANAEAMRLLLDEDVVIVDDVQYWDAASSQVFTYTFERLRESGRAPCFIDCYRRGELPAYSEGNVRQFVDAGLARVVDLEPLPPEDVHHLVLSLELPGAERHTQALAGYTGGNPLYIIETLKHLLETDGLHRDWPERLPPPGRVGPLLQRRLERLSRLALQLAQLATLRDAPLPAALAAELFAVSLADVQAALAELDAAQLLVGGRFSHDLVEEAVRATLTPEAVRTLTQRLGARS